jgi:hypothetical protein
MSQTLAALPFWEVRFDAEGDADPSADAIVDEIADSGVTDLLMFCHGWNNSPETARRLYSAWFDQLAPQLASATTARPVRVGVVGVFWPSQRWSDEPIPDFRPTPGLPEAAGGAAAARSSAPIDLGPPTVDDETLGALRSAYPQGVSQLERMADLLREEPTSGAVAEFFEVLRSFAGSIDEGADDGEGESGPVGAGPAMLEGQPEEVCARFVAQLKANGARFGDVAGGEAGLGDLLGGIWHGAKEALRQVTYWQMKNRAGVVGSRGLGPLVGRLQRAAPQLRVNLVGHSFGARVVSYALAGLPSGLSPSPVKSVTLLQGAFSHFAFADELPFDTTRAGALAGMLERVDGPLVCCFSVHDDAVGTLYPLASLASGVDSAAAEDLLYRWGGMGHDGAQATHAKLESIQPAGPGTAYPFESGRALNIDCSDVVCRGGPPSGAHSDIVHPELTWAALLAAGIVGDAAVT